MHVAKAISSIFYTTYTSLHLQWLNSFPMLSDRPLTQLGRWSTSHSLLRTLTCFYYPSLLDTLDSPCLHFDPQPLSLISVSCT